MPGGREREGPRPLDDALWARLERFAEQTSRSVNGSVEYLVQRGLGPERATKQVDPGLRGHNRQDTVAYD